MQHQEPKIAARQSMIKERTEKRLEDNSLYASAVHQYYVDKTNEELNVLLLILCIIIDIIIVI